ncbi:efflux RND transporter periplasmic adaptor subunit [Methylomonas sp. SURF-2]|uniref:Efflux RND transporter periplasmic adaptor subunit n=1 Tax=Methylomonas subterranea TaxID=2952225 RepID=A0ABT1TH03_9GAMM|nr:efflux RND transporter periplasmic adaptor subunit [Methylomonas sp. SURF-2]MCQ8104741.1 efflux RND transporter periplasmic adaptor subunit [Methylomonas sp. SURF-2]
MSENHGRRLAAAGHSFLKILLPVAVMLIAGAASWALFVLKAQSGPQAEPEAATEVSVTRVEPESLRLNVLSQGVVTPREEIDLVSEVSGKVASMHPSLVAGGFFKAGERLLTIDPRDYDYAITVAQAGVAEARRALISEQAQVEQAHSEWRALGEGEASELTLRKPQLAEAQAKLQAARADLAKAKLNRERCELKAPFAGRVLSKQAGVGQFLPAGAPVARIYASDLAEVRLPIGAEQLAFLRLPLTVPPADSTQWPKVTLSADLGGRRRFWQGRIVRVEAAVSEDSGQWYLVAQIADPFRPGADGPPLLKGLFVEAEIEGIRQDGLYRLPRAAVSPAQTVKTVDSRQTLQIKPVEVLRGDSDSVVIQSGLNPGDRVIVSELPVAVAGTPVKLRND